MNAARVPDRRVSLRVVGAPLCEVGPCSVGVVGVPVSGRGDGEESSQHWSTTSTASHERQTDVRAYPVVIVGPIASGKSTIAGALGDRFRQAARQVAVLDLDDLVETIGGFVDLPPERFQQAQAAFGELVGTWLDQGSDVIAHGPFFQHDEDRALLHAVPEGIAPRRVLLHCTLDTALERVATDQDRVLSNYPEFLKATYQRVEELLPAMPPSEWQFDTTTIDAQSIVDELAKALVLN